MWKTPTIKEIAVGLDLKLDAIVTFSPYIEILLNGADENYAKKSMMFGTNLSFKF